MTISFCRQSLRMDLAVAGQSKDLSVPPSTIIIIPLAYPNTVCCTGTHCEYISPISTLLTAPKLMANLLPRPSGQPIGKDAAAGTAIFVLGTLLGVATTLNLRS
jgi:hypothetical protein